jgi:transcriptional regulator NrdR family protein
MIELPEWCNVCKTEDYVSVVDSRPTPAGRNRRYKCSKCDGRWSTKETKSAHERSEIGTLLDLLDTKLDNIVITIQNVEEAMAKIREKISKKR